MESKGMKPKGKVKSALYTGEHNLLGKLVAPSALWTLPNNIYQVLKLCREYEIWKQRQSSIIYMFF